MQLFIRCLYDQWIYHITFGIWVMSALTSAQLRYLLNSIPDDLADLIALAVSCHGIPTNNIDLKKPTDSNRFYFILERRHISN